MADDRSTSEQLQDLKDGLEALRQQVAQLKDDVLLLIQGLRPLRRPVAGADEHE